MTVGLGTGTTVKFLVDAVAERLNNKTLKGIRAVCTSSRTANQAKGLGIPVVDLNDVSHIDLCIDGADEVDEHFQGIKGGGGAQTLEKMVATNSLRNIWIVDASKMVKQLGTFPLPTEVIPFGCERVFTKLKWAGLEPKFRLDDAGKRFVTHNGNYIIDLHLGRIDHPHKLAQYLDRQVGILEHGLFLDIVDEVVVGTNDGVREYKALR